MASISVIIPIFKAEIFLGKCIESVLSQDYKDFQLILVDDGSPDKCGQICEYYAKKDNRIKTIHKENGGVSDARNAGLDQASGEYLTFIDADDYVETTYLSYLLSLISQRGYQVGRANHFIDRGNSLTTNAPVKGEMMVFPRKDAVEAALYHDRVDTASWGAIYKHALFDNVRFPKGRIYEDTYVFCDIICQADCFVFGDQPQYHYVQHSGSIVNQSFNIKNLEFIDSVKRLADYAAEEYPSLLPACHRRTTHSYLSVLRKMGNIGSEYYELRRNLRDNALQYSNEVIANPKAPSRDKTALILLRLGFFPFYSGWYIYSLLRE